MSETMGGRIARYRDSLGWNQTKLAEAVTGSSRPQTVSSWETDQSTPDLKDFFRLTEVLGVDPYTLWYGPAGSPSGDPALDSLVFTTRTLLADFLGDAERPRDEKIRVLDIVIGWFHAHPLRETGSP